MRLILLSCCILFTSLGSVFSQNLIVGSYNIRLDSKGDSGNLWKDRAPYVSALIRFHDFDIVGTQEGFFNQLQDMQKDLPVYSYYGVGRDDAKTKGEHSAIFYKKEKFTVLDSGNFWLSETPEKPGFGWDAKHNRICSWLQLKDKKKKKTFFVFNVHFDHQGVVARNESSKLILKKIQEIAGNKPVVLTGDFNGNHTSSWYQLIANSSNLKDAYTLATDPYKPNGSFNAFRASSINQDLIDHIFISKSFTVKRFGILTDTYFGKFPADHFPVLTELSWK